MEGGFFLEEDDLQQGAPHSTAVPTAAPEHRPGCTHCSNLSWNEEWHRTFGVRLCNDCKRSHRLISKSTAKQRYHLTDADLKLLGSLRKANPHRKDWQPMHLYLEAQVEAASHEKHGGAEGLEAHAQRLLDNKMQERIKRRENAKRKEQEEAEKLSRIKRKMEEEDEQRRQQQQSLLSRAASSAGGGSRAGKQAAEPCSDVQVEEI